MLEASLGEGTDIFRLNRVSPVVTLTCPHRFSETFAALGLMWKSHSHPFRDLYLPSYVEYLVAMVLSDWHEAGASPRPVELCAIQDQFAEVIQFMAEHLGEEIRLADLATQVHLHPNYFHRVFKHAYGMTPQHMLRSLRLSTARTLLETTDDPVESLALRCGIGDARCFSPWFRQGVGTSHRTYRARSREVAHSYLSIDLSDSTV